MKDPASNTDSSRLQQISLARWALVSRVEELLRQQWPLSAALEQVATTCPYQLEGEPAAFAAKRTLENWYYAFVRGGLPALQPKTRSDRGRPRRLSSSQQEWVLAQVRSFPGIAIKTLYRQWKKTDPSLPTLASVYRWLEQNNLDIKGRRYLLRQSVSGPTKAFETPAVNELWMADFSPGPFLKIVPKAQATHLCLILDDHSRLVTFAAYGQSADTQAFLYCLQQAVSRRGLPRKLYTDNGGPFVNDHVKIVCANLGIRLLHAKPRHAWSKGKCERIFRTIQCDFEATLRLPGQGAGSLDELNAKFALWLQEVYHTRVHEGTGQCPQDRFAQAISSIRTLDKQLDLPRLFFTRLKRLVRKDGTVRIDNVLYEVNLALRGLDVDLHFDPWRKDRIEVRYKGQDFGLARRVNHHLNSQIHPADYGRA